MKPSLMLSSRRLTSMMFLCGTVFLFCLASSTISEAQTPQPKSKIPKSKITALNQVPTVVHSLLPVSNISTGGAASSLACFLNDNVNVIELDGKYVEVHECGSTIDGKPVPDVGGGGGPDAASPSPGNGIPTPGVGTDPEDCELFTTALKQSCSAAMPIAERTNCQYNACVQGAKCAGQPISQCGPKPKSTSGKNPSVCSNSYGANFNACTRRFRTIGGQNSCLYAAGQALTACTTQPAK